MMAAAEARAVWQRTANRCFVQEDAKRAPKLACCQSSSSSSKQVDVGPSGVADVPDHPAPGFMPLSRNRSCSNLPPDTRWWLQLQPNCAYPKGLTCEQLSSMEAEVENLRAGFVKSPDVIGEQQSDDGDGTLVDGNKNSKVSDSVLQCLKKDPEDRKQVLGALDCKTTQELLELMETKEKYELTETDSVGYQTSKKLNEAHFDPESPWIGGAKTEPWWRMTDKDDLASLVAQKSLDYIENCDLPPPQKIHVRRNLYARAQCVDHVKASSLDWKSCTDQISNRACYVDHVENSSLDWKSRTELFSNPIIHARGSSDPGITLVGEAQMPYDSDKSFRYSTTHKGITETRQISESDPCKAQLLEALCHSQTRAREAETAAKQAYAEKEHILKLFFRQASQLFAYKQWFQLLQLEALYFQIKNSDQPISTLFPVALPWMPRKGRKVRKSLQKAAKGKRGKQGREKHEMPNYFFAFALGLGLVGAGLLLGWSVGWMFF